MAKFVRKEKVLHLRIFTLEIKICKFKISCCEMKVVVLCSLFFQGTQHNNLN